MEKAYQRFEQRKSQRRQAFFGFLAFVVIIIVVGIYTHGTLEWLYNIWVFFATFISIIVFFYLVSRPWSGENHETKIFVDLYDAIRFLDLVTNQDENSSFYSGKAARKLNAARIHIKRLARTLDQIDSVLIKKSCANH